jgi:hypothetical protein
MSLARQQLRLPWRSARRGGEAFYETPVGVAQNEGKYKGWRCREDMLQFKIQPMVRYFDTNDAGIG